MGIAKSAWLWLFLFTAPACGGDAGGATEVADSQGADTAADSAPGDGVDADAADALRRAQVRQQREHRLALRVQRFDRGRDMRVVDRDHRQRLRRQDLAAAHRRSCGCALPRSARRLMPRWSGWRN